MSHPDRVRRRSRTTPSAISCAKSPKCLDNDGTPIDYCRQAETWATPASEDMCPVPIDNEKIFTSDPYKRQYREACRAIDSALATPGLNPYQVNDRFASIQLALDLLIKAEGVNLSESGRLVYHVNSRMLGASLELFRHRADRPGEPFPREILKETHTKYSEIIFDFYEDGKYEPYSEIVAHKRLELEMAYLLSRRLNSNDFPLPALYREEAGPEQRHNHDLTTYGPEGKTPIQVKHSDSYGRPGRGPSIEYSPTVALVIYSQVCQIGSEAEVTLTQTATPGSTNELLPDIEIPYAHHDPESYPEWGIAWRAASQLQSEGDELVFIQTLGGPRDGLIEMIVAEANGEVLTPNQLNLLNAMTHYLVAKLHEARGVKPTLADRQ